MVEKKGRAGRRSECRRSHGGALHGAGPSARQDGRGHRERDNTGVDERRDEEMNPADAVSPRTPEMENVSPWVREMGWAEHFAGKDKTMIHEATLMPRARRTRAAQGRQGRQQGLGEGELDERLTRLGESFNRVIQRCCERMKVVPHETLR
jgi:hypothetical protein